MSAHETLAIVFDVETTGNDPQRDQVIELSIQEGISPGGTLRTWRFKPSVPISAEAQAVHGIRIEDLCDCPSFQERVDEIWEIFVRAQIFVGYNVRFDLDFVRQEFRRVGRELSLERKSIIDPLLLWRKLEPRRLQDAYKRFVGGELEGAHSAAVDVAATSAVLDGMLRAFELPTGDWSKVAELCAAERKPNWIGPSHHFQWQDGKPVFGFGKHRNRPLSEVMYEENGGYLDWLVRSDFPDHVKQIARTAPSKSPEELARWLSETFGGAEPKAA